MKNWLVQLRVGWRKEWEEKLTEHIKTRIRQAREEKGISQRELSRRLDRSNTYVQHLESGRLDLPVIDLVGLVFEFDKPLEYFLPLEEKDKTKLSGREWELVQKFRGIKDDATKDFAIKQIAQLAKLEKTSKEK